MSKKVLLLFLCFVIVVLSFSSAFGSDNIEYLFQDLFGRSRKYIENKYLGYTEMQNVEGYWGGYYAIDGLKCSDGGGLTVLVGFEKDIVDTVSLYLQGCPELVPNENLDEATDIFLKYYGFADKVDDLKFLGGDPESVYVFSLPGGIFMQVNKIELSKDLVFTADCISLDLDETPKQTNNTSSTPYKIGDSILFGHYEQDNNTANGKEPIEWIILAIDHNRALLLSRYVLDAIEYDYTYETHQSHYTWSNIAMGITVPTATPAPSPVVTWEGSTIRNWLNNNFYTVAFSNDERDRIIPTRVTDEVYNKSIRNNPFQVRGMTTDKIFLLSYSEVNDLFPDNKSRDGSPTQYASTKGYLVSEWILRSRFFEPFRGDTILYVDYSGNTEINNGINPDDAGSGIRPALWYSLY